MSIFIEEEGGTVLPFSAEAVARTVIEAALEYEKCPYETEVSLLLTTDEEVRKLNCTARGMDRPTDVLSFPMLEYDAPGDFSWLEDEPQDAFNPETGELILGDIVISKDRVMAQAEEYGHSPLREYAFLIAHSMLHLLGYDHMEEEERRLMEDRQRDIMEKAGIPR